MRAPLLVLLCTSTWASSPAFSQSQPTHAGLTYATVGSQPLLLDLYLPSTGTSPYPVIVYIHGGGWMTGSRYPLSSPCELALSQGFAVAAIEYRMTSQAAQFAPESVVFPAQIHDCKGAVRWLRANAATYQLDPNRIAAHGFSAGGQLSALLATSGGVAALEGDVGGNQAFSSRVQAAADFYGPTAVLRMNDDVTTPPGSVSDHDAPSSPESRLVGWGGPGQGLGDIKLHIDDPNPPYPLLLTRIHDLNPISWLDASDPPLFVAHGTHDMTVAVKQSLRLSAEAFAIGIVHEFRAVPGQGHSLSGPIDGVTVDFLRCALNGTLPPSAGTSFCAGDGTAAACPCGNASYIGAREGCTHSYVVGANLSAVGVPSVSNDSLVLRASSMPNTQTLFFQAPAALNGGAGHTFGDGLRCIGPNTRRLGLKLNTSGWSVYPEGSNLPVSIRGAATAGATLHYQAWFRDPDTSCGPATFNLTNALSITWQP